MKKAILLSIKPKYVYDILYGKKILELRKTMPRCALPIDVYIYCCERKNFNETLSVAKLENRAKTIEDYGGLYLYGFDVGHADYDIVNGSIVAKFTLNKVKKIPNDMFPNKDFINGEEVELELNYFRNIIKKSCLETIEFIKYQNNKDLYAWHIDNLEIFDDPMELSEFYKSNWEDLIDKRDCKNCKYQDYDLQEHQTICGIDYDGQECPYLRVNKAPQSWQYVYLKDKVFK